MSNKVMSRSVRSGFAVDTWGGRSLTRFRPSRTAFVGLWAWVRSLCILGRVWRSLRIAAPVCWTPLGIASSELRVESGGFCGLGKNRSCDAGIRTTSRMRC